MDIDECLKILNERAQQPQNTADDQPEVKNLNISGQTHVFTDPIFTNASNSEEESENRGGRGINEPHGGLPPGIDGGAIVNMGNMDTSHLLNLFTTLQGDRVKTYKDYDRIINDLIENAELNQYPLLCYEMTRRFSMISRCIIKVKEELESDERDEKYLAKVISSIQEKEKEKLAVVAAIHLDKIKSKSPVLDAQLSRGPCRHIDGGEYLVHKIEQLEDSISEDVEEIQLAKSVRSQSDSVVFDTVSKHHIDLTNSKLKTIN